MLADFQKDLAEMVNDFPSEIAFDGKSCACFLSERREEIDFNEDGEYTPSSYTALYNIAELPVPSVRDVVQVDGVKYYVENADRLKTGNMQLQLRRL